MSDPQQMPRLFRPAQIAEMLQVSRDHVYRLTSLGQIHAIRISGSIRVRGDEVARLIEFGTQQTPTE